MRKVIIAGLFLGTAGAALAQEDNPCKGLRDEACCANAACTWVHMLMPGETVLRHIAVERCQRRSAPMHPRALSMLWMAAITGAQPAASCGDAQFSSAPDDATEDKRVRVARSR
jgi:hypothetical protein